jgi:hypothetical protein
LTSPAKSVNIASEETVYIILPDSKYNRHFCHPRKQVLYHFGPRTIYEYLQETIKEEDLDDTFTLRRSETMQAEFTCERHIMPLQFVYKLNEQSYFK